MACLEHLCLLCRHVWFSNRTESCPKCGSSDVDTWFDEQPDPEPPEPEP
jgi:hypothetical protein